MDVNKAYLQLEANFKNIEDKAVSKENLAVQFFDPEKNLWVILIDGLVAHDGKLEEQFRMVEFSKTNPEGYAQLKNGLTNNILPTIRLVDGTTVEEDWTVVYSVFPVIHVQEENTLVLDFGDLWVLESNQINRHIKGRHPEVEFAVGALPRPNGNHAFFPSFQAGLLYTEELADFTIGEHDVKLVRRGEEEELGEKIEALHHMLEEKERIIEEGQAEIEHLKNQIEELENRDPDNPDDVVDGELTEDGEFVDGKGDGKLVEARPARDVYTTIVDEVRNASEKLEETPYSLANISLNLKTHVVTDEEGFKLQLIDAETAKNTSQESFSEVTIDIGTKGPTRGGAEKLVAPNIVGLTETAARQRLKAFGLKMKVIYQTTTTKTVGQAFKQKPAAGDDINKGDTIITIFAKNSEKFN